MTKTVKKVVAGISALVILGGAAVGAWAVMENSRSSYPSFDQIEADKEYTTDLGEAVTDEGGAEISETVENGVQLMSAKIEPKDFAANGISPMAETAYQLTATITPSDAYNKAVDWSVEWVNPLSTWASGKPATGFVTVTPTSDGALTANVECKAAFGEQIKVVCTSRDNPEASAECIVDYAKRITGVTVKLSSAVNSVSVSSTSKEVTIPATFSTLHYAGITSTTGVGTVSDSFTYTVKIKGSSTVASAINSGTSGQLIVSAREVDLTSEDLSLTPLDIFNNLYSTIQINAPAQDAADIIARESVNSPFAYITVNAVGEYSSYSCELALNAAAGVLTVSVSSVAVNEDSLTF